MKKKKVKNETHIRVGDNVYHVWYSDAIDTYEITRIDVLNERCVDMTLKKISGHKSYHHLIVENTHIEPALLVSEHDIWGFSLEECYKKIADRRDINRRLRIADSIKIMYDFLKE